MSFPKADVLAAHGDVLTKGTDASGDRKDEALKGKRVRAPQ